MTMLNQAAVEALCSATYLEHFLEAVENLPDDVQGNISQLRELDIKSRELLQDVEYQKSLYMQQDSDNHSKKKAALAVRIGLLKCQEIGDEKLQIVGSILEAIENRARQLEQDQDNLYPSTSKENEKEPEPAKKEVKQDTEKVEKTSNKRQRRQKNHDTNNDDMKISEEKEKPPKKKKKRKTKKELEDSPVEIPVDPNEPLYCTCRQVSYGEMVGCDNYNCEYEWFHFGCVGLTTKPKGKWYCPDCRGDRPSVKKPDK